MMFRSILASLALPVVLAAAPHVASAQSWSAGWSGSVPTNTVPVQQYAPSYGQGYAGQGAYVHGDRYVRPPVYGAPPVAYAPVPAPPVYVASAPVGVDQGQQWRDPRWFSMRVHQRMDAIQSSVQQRVAQGAAPAWQLNALAGRRAEAEQILAQASRDGQIRPEERQYVRQIVDRMESIAMRGYGRGEMGVGGGPAWRQYGY